MQIRKMKRVNSILAIILFCTLVNCKTPVEQSAMTDNIIRLSDAIENMEEVFLSEIADSISYIIIETRSDCLIGGGTPKFTFSPSFIYYYNSCFDWDGKFYRKIGQRGNGPCEDPGEMISYLLFKDNHFYSKGMKLIEYNNNGRCTKKERGLSGVDKSRGVFSGLFNAAGFALAGDNFMIFSHPDTVFFLNKDFQFVASRQVLASFPAQTRYINTLGGPFATSFHDTTVFYNFFNDTIFHVTDTDLIPKWIVDLDDKKRVPIELLTRQGELLTSVWEAYQSGRIENSEIVKITDNKFVVKSIYETNRHIFLFWSKMIQFAELRKKEPPIRQVAYYDKSTGKTTAVKGKGFSDDIWGMDYFYPNCGAYVDKLIKAIWPYELHDFIEECQSKGKKIHPKLLELAKKVKPDDNPVLLVAHLKDSLYSQPQP